MPRETQMTKRDFKAYLKKDGMKEENFINYYPKEKRKDDSLDVMKELNRISEQYDGTYKVVLQGCDLKHNYLLYRIVKKDD